MTLYVHVVIVTATLYVHVCTHTHTSHMINNLHVVLHTCTAWSGTPIIQYIVYSIAKTAVDNRHSINGPTVMTG